MVIASTTWWPSADIALGAQQRAQVVDGSEAVLLDDGREPAFKQVVLVIFQHDAHSGMDMLLKKSIVLRQDLVVVVWLSIQLPLNFSP